MTAIKSGGLAAELGAELKAVTVELEQLKARRVMLDIPRTAPNESVERRVARMLEQLARGGEIAQSIVRELFPDGIWLYPDPNGGRFLWATAQTVMLYPAGLVDADGRSLAEGFPRVYNKITTAEAAEIVGNSMVAGA